MLQIDANTSKTCLHNLQQKVCSLLIHYQDLSYADDEKRQGSTKNSSFQMPTTVNLEMKNVHPHILLAHTQSINDWCGMELTEPSAISTPT
jgi:hypothetical protein